ncbi:ricin-type beta-trefoil lectin domain protein [soil metagenome]
MRAHQNVMNLLALIWFTVSSCLAIPMWSQQMVTIDGRSKGGIFEGIGALSAGASSRLLVDYPEPQRSQILDYLFKPHYGASLQHLKVEVGGDVNSTDGSEPSHMRSPMDRDFTRGYEWWLMLEAKKRNPKIILDTLPWGAPGWVGSGKLYSPDMARYMADFITSAKKKYGLKIAYTGIWNERKYDAAYVKQLRRALDAAGLTTKIVCCDQYETKNGEQWEIAVAMQSDLELNSAIAVIGSHYPQEAGQFTTTEAARNSGKHLWSSEDQPNTGSGPILQRTWNAGGRILATVYNRNYLEGALTKTEIWSPITSYYDILAAPNSGLMYANTPWSGYYDVQSAIWVTAHTTQFAQPGWQYLDAGSGKLSGGGTFVTLRSPDGKSWSTVVETIEATKPQQVRFKLKNGLATITVHIWQTNGAKFFEHVADVPVKDGAYDYRFDPDSLYTLTSTTGQHKGVVTPPVSAAFPMPYADDFEQTPLSRAPKYLSDQNGAFEAHPCKAREGRCLEQVITQKPIPWGPLPDPFTLAGDVAQRDYTVSVDSFFVDNGPVTVMGRVDSADVFQDGTALWPSGYVLSLLPDGRWQLSSSVYKKPIHTLAAGKTEVTSKRWQHLELHFAGKTVSATVNGRRLFSGDDGDHAHGMFAIGTGWTRAQFDDLKVTPD